MPNGKRPARRTPVAAITDAALDLFDQLQALEYPCAEWWRLHWDLHRELHLRPWQGFSNFTSDDPETLRRHDMLKAASDARK